MRKQTNDAVIERLGALAKVRRNVVTCVTSNSNDGDSTQQLLSESEAVVNSICRKIKTQ